ncbi:acyltransferase [Nocardioides fonticola]|uniref:Acyltransferase n=1 Tax=Nocardioides fonticola TaxID=450363 RepID=A0ABP7XAR5_9ACTN
MRFVAAGLVVVTHATFYAGERLDPSFPTWHFGEIGVPIFFVISGFVMVVSTQDLVGKDDGWKYFSARRGTRIVPLYWTATTVKLLTMVVVPGAVLHAALSPQTVLSSYFFLPSYNADGELRPLLGVGWTLIFEVFFYIIFAIGMRVSRRPALFSTAVLLPVAIGGFALPGDVRGEWTFYFSGVLLYFVMGMWIGALWTKRLDGPIRMLAIATVTVAACWSSASAATGSPSPSHYLLAPTIFLLTLVAESTIGARLPRWFLIGGDASYALYLFHPIVAPAVPALMSKFGLVYPWLSVVGGFGAALVAGIIGYYFIERPALEQTRRRWKYAGKMRGAGLPQGTVAR